MYEHTYVKEQLELESLDTWKHLAYALDIKDLLNVETIFKYRDLNLLNDGAFFYIMGERIPNSSS